MLKTEIEGPAKEAGLWLRNIQLGIFALPLSAGAMLINDWDQVREYGILQGFDNVVVWLVVLLIGAGLALGAASIAKRLVPDGGVWLAKPPPLVEPPVTCSGSGLGSGFGFGFESASHRLRGRRAPIPSARASSRERAPTARGAPG